MSRYAVSVDYRLPSGLRQLHGLRATTFATKKAAQVWVRRQKKIAAKDPNAWIFAPGRIVGRAGRITAFHIEQV